MTPSELPLRKGARRVQDINPQVLALLNTGQTQSVNLTEWLATDQACLLTHILQQIGKEEYLPVALEALQGIKQPTAMKNIATLGHCLGTQSRLQHDTTLLPLLAGSSADLPRCWASYMVGTNPLLSTTAKLEQMQAFAADLHFGVREIAWMATRSTIIADLSTCLQLLSQWAQHPDANIRRFASEATRPRGVWCSHIEPLKKEPWLALPLLSALKADSSTYVQDSVGNWLNDASKTAPDWVEVLCDEWQEESPQKSTRRISNKALRSIRKA